MQLSEIVLKFNNDDWNANWMQLETVDSRNESIL